MLGGLASIVGMYVGLRWYLCIGCVRCEYCAMARDAQQAWLGGAHAAAGAAR